MCRHGAEFEVLTPTGLTPGTCVTQISILSHCFHLTLRCCLCSLVLLAIIFSFISSLLPSHVHSYAQTILTCLLSLSLTLSLYSSSSVSLSYSLSSHFYSHLCLYLYLSGREAASEINIPRSLNIFHSSQVRAF